MRVCLPPAETVHWWRKANYNAKVYFVFKRASFEFRIHLGTERPGEGGGEILTSYRFCGAAGKNWTRTIAEEGGRSPPTSYVPSVESFFQDVRVGAAPGLPGRLSERGGLASREGRRRRAALTGAEVTPAGALVTGRGTGTGTGAGLSGEPPLRSHGPARPPTPGPARAGPERPSVKSAGGSITTLGGTDLAAAGDGGKGRAESLEEANVTFVGRSDSVAVSTIKSFVLERPESRCEQWHGPSAGVSSGRCARAARLSPARAEGSESSLSVLLSTQKGNTECKQKEVVFLLP